jgi:hypothetical protein
LPPEKARQASHPPRHNRYGRDGIEVPLPRRTISNSGVVLSRSPRESGQSRVNGPERTTARREKEKRAMELNRNQFFMLGTVLLLLGLQIREVDTYVLTPKCTRLLADKTGHPMAAAIEAADSLGVSESASVTPHPLKPPEWLGWSLMSIGAVLILHSLAMKKPD